MSANKNMIETDQLKDLIARIKCEDKKRALCRWILVILAAALTAVIVVLIMKKFFKHDCKCCHHDDDNDDFEYLDENDYEDVEVAFDFQELAEETAETEEVPAEEPAAIEE